MRLKKRSEIIGRKKIKFLGSENSENSSIDFIEDNNNGGDILDGTEEDDGNDQQVGGKSSNYNGSGMLTDDDFLDEEEDDGITRGRRPSTRQTREQHSFSMPLSPSDHSPVKPQTTTQIDYDDEEEVKFNDDNELEGEAGTGRVGDDSSADEADVDQEDAGLDGKKKKSKGPSMRAIQQAKFISRLNKKKQKFNEEFKPILEHLRDGLGTLQGKVFYHSEDCVRRLHRIKELLASDTSTDRAIWKQLVEWKLLQNELMNIVACNRRYSSENDNEELLFASVNLMVALTQPPTRLSDVITHKRIPKKEEHFHLKNQYRLLQEMKLGFLLRDSVTSLMETLIPGDEAVQNNNFLIETKQSSSLLSYEEYTMLVIQLLVNLMKIPDAKPNVLSSNDQISQMQENLIKQMDQARMLKFINAVIQKLFVKYDAKVNRNMFTRNKVIDWYFLCLQFICLITANETPESLFEAERSLSRITQRTVSSVPKASDLDQALLKKLLDSEEEQKLVQQASLSSRHSRFGGLFISHFGKSSVEDTEENTDEKNPYTEVKKIVQPNIVKVTRQIFTTNNPLIGEDVVIERQLCVRERLRDPHFSRLSSQTKKILKDFLYVFYKHSFNTFFERIWESITYQRESILTQEATQNANHEANFLFLGAFMLDFNRQLYYHHIELTKRLVEVYTRDPTFDISSIASVIQLPELIQYIFDRVVNFAYETKDWNTLTQSSYFLKEFILCLEMMFKQTGEKRDYVQIASALLHKILYEPKRVEIIPRMIRIFEPNYFPRSYLTNMIELAHVFIQILKLNEEEKYETFFTKKQTKKRKKEKTVMETDGDEEAIPVDEDKDGQYDMHQEFDLDRFKWKFAHSSSVRPYLLLLEDYAINSPKINSYILDMIKMICDECACQILFFNVLTMAFFSKVLTKKNDLYPKDKPELLMTERERTNKKLVELILNLVRDWRTMLLNDTVFGKHHQVEAWFYKTKKGVSILKGEDSDVEEDVYSDSERKNRRQNRRKQGLASATFSDHDDLYPTSAGEDNISNRQITMSRDLDNILGGSNISPEDGEGEYEYEFDSQEPQEEVSHDHKRRKRKRTTDNDESADKNSSAKRKKVAKPAAPESEEDEGGAISDGSSRTAGRRRQRKRGQQKN